MRTPCRYAVTGWLWLRPTPLPSDHPRFGTWVKHGLISILVISQCLPGVIAAEIPKVALWVAT